MKNILFAALATIMLFALNSCARKTTFLASSVVPAAEGKVKVKKDKNKNYDIKVNILHLAESSKLQPPKQTYVVWMVTDDGLTKNIGQISSSTGFLSGKLKASFHTVSSFKPVKIFITGEDNADIQYPNSQVVLSTGSF